MILFLLLILFFILSAFRHLFKFKHGKVIIRNGVEPRYKSNPEDGSVVTVEFGGNIPHNDLISCISDSLSKFDSQGSTHDIIIRPSEVITFMLRRNPTPPGATKASTDPFMYPKTIYLDRFLFINLALTNDKRAAEYKILEQIRELKAMKHTLTRLEVGILANVMSCSSSICLLLRMDRMPSRIFARQSIITRRLQTQKTILHGSALYSRPRIT